MNSHAGVHSKSQPREKIKTFASPGSTGMDGGNPPAPASLFSAGAAFLHQNVIKVLGTSAAMLIPCFWHKRMEAGDLASHTYNAWLAQLIARGQAPGLWIATQWNNVLFDVCLARLGGIVGLAAAEKFCVSAAVLIFFWGAFAMMSAITQRAPWSLTPLIAMISYGWTLQQGFLNYYISLGLAFFGCALVQRGRGLERAIALVLLALSWIAHPLGAAFLVGFAFYETAAGWLEARNRPLLFTAAAIFLVAAGNYLVGHYPVYWPDRASLHAFFAHSGADQLLLYSARYSLPSNLLIAFFLICIAADMGVLRKRGESWSVFALPLQLYGLAILAGVFLPSAVRLSTYAVPVGFLQDRLTTVSAVLACCVLGAARQRKWHFPVLAAIAACFFALLYSDTGQLNKMEARVERYTRSLTPGERVIASIGPAHGSRLLINHIVDRACIGYCFSYGNYEPSSGQFRVRALAGNPFVVSDSPTFDQMESGHYVVRAQDLPISQIYRCKTDETTLCSRELTAGDKVGVAQFQGADTPLQ